MAVSDSVTMAKRKKNRKDKSSSKRRKVDLYLYKLVSVGKPQQQRWAVQKAFSTVVYSTTDKEGVADGAAEELGVPRGKNFYDLARSGMIREDGGARVVFKAAPPIPMATTPRPAAPPEQVYD